MKFRTEIDIKDAPFLLNPERLVLLAGSCFADNIGAKIKNADWKAAVNPCGVIYNPASMAVIFQLALTDRISRRFIVEASLTQRESHTVSWLMDSKVAAKDPETAVNNVMEAIDALEKALETADCLMLTFGTPDVYLLEGTDRAVGNCHKHPAAEFNRRRLGISEISDTWIGLIEMMRQRNPDLKVIFTVSPRRYLSDGFAENSRKKAILLLACENICNSLGNVFYFPAYEILMDDLRDYRFYAEDMLHPSAGAVDYIWEKFCHCFLDAEGREKVKKGEKRVKASLHRPLLG